MSVVSKFAPKAFFRLNGSSLGVLRPLQLTAVIARYSHGHTFKKRQGQMYFNRFKDVIHFYYIGLGFIPLGILLFVVHVIYGPCILTEIPTDGPPPNYWQYERTPLRQWYAKHIGISDMEYHERNLSLKEKFTILERWRKIEQRVKHLQGERWDYKGYYYQPLSSTWIDYARKAQERLFWQYEEHGHSLQ